MAVRPSIFVGSSSEGRRVADYIQVELDLDYEVEIWSQGTFGLGDSTLASLVGALSRFDFAVLVVTADDAVTTRGKVLRAARDNVIFELGLFMGGLGPSRTFMVTDRTNPPALPSDLAGVTRADFAPHASGNLQAALGPACTKIRDAVMRLGPRDVTHTEHLSQAAHVLDDASSTLGQLIGLIARSRKVELDVILTQFGPMIDPARVAEMRRDLDDLEAVLRKIQ